MFFFFSFRLGTCCHCALVKHLFRKSAAVSRSLSPRPPFICSVSKSLSRPFFPFIKTRLFLFCTIPSSQILLKEKKKTERERERKREKMRGRNGGEQSLSEEQGPLDQGPSACQRMEEDERMKGRGEKMPSILSKDRFFFPFFRS